MRIILTLGFKAPESWIKAFPKQRFEYQETGSEGLRLLKEAGAELAVVIFGNEFSISDPGKFATLYHQFREAGFQGAFLPNVGEERNILETLAQELHLDTSHRWTDKRVRSSRLRLPNSSSSQIQQRLLQTLTKKDLVHFFAA